MIDVVKDKYTLMFGDCLERMKEIPDGSIDAVICDPLTLKLKMFGILLLI